MAKTGVITRKGQVTLPVEFRKALGLHEGDRVTFELQEGGIRVIRRTSVTERTAGMFRTNLPPLTAEELRAAAEKAWAEEAAERNAP